MEFQFFIIIIIIIIISVITIWLTRNKSIMGLDIDPVSDLTDKNISINAMDTSNSNDSTGTTSFSLKNNQTLILHSTNETSIILQDKLHTIKPSQPLIISTNKMLLNPTKMKNGGKGKTILISNGSFTFDGQNVQSSIVTHNNAYIPE